MTPFRSVFNMESPDELSQAFAGCMTEPIVRCVSCRDEEVMCAGETCHVCINADAALADAIANGTTCAACHGDIVTIPDGDSAYRECSECGRVVRR